MTTIQIKISAKKSEIITTTVFKRGGKSISTLKVMNENITYCIEQYVSAGKLVSMSLTPNGDADTYYTGLIRLKEFFNTEECFFGNELMILVKEANLKAA